MTGDFQMVGFLNQETIRDTIKCLLEVTEDSLPFLRWMNHSLVADKMTWWMTCQPEIPIAGQKCERAHRCASLELYCQLEGVNNVDPEDRVSVILRSVFWVII